MRGGENLNSNDINDNLDGCPGVVDHAVIGMPDERLGERICAFVVTDGTVVTTDTHVMAATQGTKFKVQGSTG